MKNIAAGHRHALVLCTALLLFGTAHTPPVQAAPLSLGDAPLFLLTTVEPNILLTFDDSGSMSWGYLPDTISGLDGNRRGCSSTINGVYYDPSVTYSPGVDADGNSLGNANFTAAWINGFNQGAGTVNLATSYRPVWRTNSTTTSNTSYASCNSAPVNGAQPAFYYNYNPAGTGCSPANTGNDNCYTRVQVTTLGAAEQQNFANWYSYYRVRTLMAKTAAGRAFARLTDNVRLAYQRLNTCRETFGNQANGTNLTSTTGCYGNTVKLFSGANRTDFFTWLYASPASSGTPLLPATQRAGQYLTTTGSRSPWAQNPGVAQGTEYSCRQNFHVAFTDGYWNSGFGVAGNVDDTAIAFPPPMPAPDRYPYVASYSPGGADQKIYRDGNASFLADNAFYYWSQDLRADLENNVPRHIVSNTGNENADFFNPVNDPAHWQHMVNYTVGLGIPGVLNYPGDYNSLLSGALTWPVGSAAVDGPHKTDDLWHAAINSRGRYFSADNPTQLVDSFSAVLNDIADRSGSAAALAANSGALSTSSRLYQARFNSSNWSGQLLSFPINPTTGVVSANAEWDAGEVINTQHYDTGREIITFKPSTRNGVAFRWVNLDGAQQTALNTNASSVNDGQGAARLNYLRGATGNEGASGNGYRVRACYSGGSTVACPPDTGKLGDILDSAPLYVGAPYARYPDDLESSPYSAFKNANQNRPPRVYAGANDGMLHVFNAITGREELAYVPSPVYTNLSLLTSPTYSHRHYVNGRATAGDAYINNAWKTVLVGGLNKGGRGYYALDVTNPGSFSEGNAGNIVLWEFTDTDLGYTYSQPAIVRMANGKWAAVFGNGYNNITPGSGRGILYIVFIEDGIDGTWSASDFVKIDTGVGNTTTPNGLASPAAADVNGDGIADYIYAGDLRGNMWRFDVSSSSSADWTDSGNRSVLFTAQSGTGTAQPVTSRPMVGRHPDGYVGVMVYFGTGKYLEPSDSNITGSTTQSFYGIWDKGDGVAVPRNDLLRQTISSAAAGIRKVTNNTIAWRAGPTPPTPSHLGWYVDLPDAGERQVTNSVLRDDRIIFTTLIPSDTPCTPGGRGWIMELNARNGGRLPDTFDLDGDGDVDANDRLSEGSEDFGAAGVEQRGGAPSEPVIQDGSGGGGGGGGGSGSCREYKYTSTFGGSISTAMETCPPLGRGAWRQVK